LLAVVPFPLARRDQARPILAPFALRTGLKVLSRNRPNLSAFRMNDIRFLHLYKYEVLRVGVVSGREAGIRTRVLPVPNRAPYQAEPLPDAFSFHAQCSGHSVPRSRTEWL